MQPPFFDPYADPAVNYGAVGGVIGHEMGHGYDDQGAKSDEKGVLRTWWKKEDEVCFQRADQKAGGAVFVCTCRCRGSMSTETLPRARISAIWADCPLPWRPIRPRSGGKPAPVLDGFTGVQRFFLGWSQVWRGLYRDVFLRTDSD